MENENQLIQISQARQALIEARDLYEIMEIRDQSKAIAAYLDAKGAADAANVAKEVQLYAERKAGEFLLQMEKNKGAMGNPHGQGVRYQDETTQTYAELGIKKTAAHRWQTIAKMPEEKFEKTITKMKTDGELTASRIYAVAKGEHWAGLYSSENIEWWTPQRYIDAVHNVMSSIDLDPASTKEANEIVRAKKYFTEENDGLSQGWRGRIFLNPPYGKLGPLFVEKLLAEFNKGQITEFILLVNSNSTDTNWFAPLFDGLICFTNHRIDFDSPMKRGNNSTHGSCFIYFGNNKKQFISEFKRFGHVIKKA